MPINRLDSILSYGLVPNDKLNELNINNELKKINFYESEIGYIYGSTCIRNAIDWYKVIKIQVKCPCLLLKYDVDSSIIEQDTCSPHKIKTDVRFKGVSISQEDITVVSVKVYNHFYTDFNEKKEVPLLEMINFESWNDIKSCLIDDEPLMIDIYKKTMDNLDRDKKGIYYTVTIQEGVKYLKNYPQFDYSIIASLANIDEFEMAGRPTTFTTDIENAVAWKNIVEHLSGCKARILKCSIQNSLMYDNYTGINGSFSNVIALEPINSKSVINII